ncbi:MAG: phytoene desaturase family protein [Solirubrobacteraceae bacterium]
MGNTEGTADVIVAGGGHNGLVAACYLARAGLDVEVLEASPVIGGMTATNEMLPEAPGHFINEASIHASLFRNTAIDSELELTSKYGLRMRSIDPAHVHLGFEGESIAMWRDANRTAAEISHFSKKDARAWLDFVESVTAGVEIGLPLMLTSAVRPEPKQLAKALVKMGKHRKELLPLARWILQGHAEAIEERFEHPMVRGPLTINLPFMPFDSDASAYALIYLGVYHRTGVAMFEGGTGAFPEALIACLQDAGGRVRANARVEEILVDGDRAVGVRLEGGEELRARRAVMTAFSPKRVLGDLLPKGVLSHADEVKVRHIPTNETGARDYKLNLALKGKLQMPRHQEWRAKTFPGDSVDLKLPCLTWHTHEQALEAFRACVRGEVPEHVPGLSQITTAFDPGMAPEGHDTFWFWTGLTPGTPNEGWDVARDKITKRVIEESAYFYEGLEELEIGRRPLAKPDIEKRFNAIDGNVYHVDPIITRLGPLRPAVGMGDFQAPVDGLWMTGSGTHSIPGISGMPGHNASKHLLRSLRKRKGGLLRRGSRRS